MAPTGPANGLCDCLGLGPPTRLKLTHRHDALRHRAFGLFAEGSLRLSPRWPASPHDHAESVLLEIRTGLSGAWRACNRGLPLGLDLSLNTGSRLPPLCRLATHYDTLSKRRFGTGAQYGVSYFERCPMREISATTLADSANGPTETESY